jgi:peptide/nickel transport system permease protein
MSALIRTLTELKKYPTAVIGLILIALLIITSVYAVIAIPYSEAIKLWRDVEVWRYAPKNARPAWVNWFTGKKLPENIILKSAQMPETKTVEAYPGFVDIFYEFEFDYQYDDFPQELSLFFNAKYESNKPHLFITWHKPNGETVELPDISVKQQDAYRISLDTTLERKLGNSPEVALLSDSKDKASPKVLKGTYKLEIEAMFFEEDNPNLDVEFISYGKVYGFAGTDDKRRDMTVALLWGAPIALAFGLLAAVGSTMTTMIIAAIAIWYGRWVDALIRRLTEVNMIIPLLPFLIMIGVTRGRSIWLMLGCVILLNIFGGGIMTYRSMFLQIKEAGYIEAARAYGASGLRIVFKYMIPKVIPVLVPQFVSLVPAFVFLEATLALLGLGDPVLPTWGKLLSDAYQNGAVYKGYYYWVFQPAGLLMVTGLGFAMLGYALDRIFNPRLRGL